MSSIAPALLPAREAHREAIFSLWLTDLSNWPARQTVAVLNWIADRMSLIRQATQFVLSQR